MGEVSGEEEGEGEGCVVECFWVGCWVEEMGMGWKRRKVGLEGRCGRVVTVSAEVFLGGVSYPCYYCYCSLGFVQCTVRSFSKKERSINRSKKITFNNMRPLVEQ